MECNFDDGECRERFTRAGPDARNACDRSVCSAWQQNGWLGCYSPCLRASCAWSGHTGCAVTRQRLAACPLFDAAVYASLADEPGLIYVNAASIKGGIPDSDVGGRSVRPGSPMACTVIVL